MNTEKTEIKALSEEILNDVESIITQEQVVKYLFQDLEDWGKKTGFMQATGMNVGHEVLTLNLEKIHLQNIFDNLPTIIVGQPDFKEHIEDGLIYQTNDWVNKAIMLNLYLTTETHPDFVAAMAPFRNAEIDPGFFDSRITEIEEHVGEWILEDLWEEKEEVTYLSDEEFKIREIILATVSELVKKDKSMGVQQALLNALRKIAG